MRAVNQTLDVQGVLTLVRRDAATGCLLSVWEKKNVITYAGTQILVGLMAPNSALGVDVQLESQFKSMRFGVSNVSPQRTDTDLAEEAVVGSIPVRKEFQDSNRIIGAAGTIVFTATLGPSDGNGVIIREAGLFTRGDADDPQVTVGASMFSRQVFPDQVKSSAITLDASWRITYTV